MIVESPDLISALQYIQVETKTFMKCLEALEVFNTA